MKQTILIVDDEPINISVVANFFVNDYSVKIAMNGNDALRLAQNGSVDLILLDIVMPEMNGYEVAKALREDSRTSTIPFIFITSKSDTQSVVDGFKAGAVDYVSKPFALEELAARVHTHMKMQALQKSLAESNRQLHENVKALEESTKNFESIFENSYNGVALIDHQGDFLLVNESYTRITGLSKEELLKTNCLDLIHPDDLERSKQNIKDIIQDGKIQNSEKRCKHKNGDIIDINIAMTLLEDKKTILINAADMTELNRAHRKIEHYASIMDRYVISSTTDLNGIITDVSTAYTDILGYTKEEVIGKKHNITRHPDTPKSLYDSLWQTISDDRVWHGEIQNLTKNKIRFWTDSVILPDYDEHGIKTGYFAIRSIITAQKEIERLSITDDLTRLYNRRYFNEIFERELNRARRDHMTFGLIMIDVDYFKRYNDTYGHLAGDVVLQGVSSVIREYAKRSSDYAFRIGGEEFAIIVTHMSDDEIMNLATHLVRDVERLGIPHASNGASDFVTISIGLSNRFITMETVSNDLYKEADKNLYEAKANGRNHVVWNKTV